MAGRHGTIRTRLRGTAAEGRVRAKSGSLWDVAGLAGYADPLAGTRLSFAYIANGLPVSTSGRTLQAPFLLALVTESG